MVSVAQLVEHGIVAPVAVGSSPITHPSFYSGDFGLDKAGHTVVHTAANKSCGSLAQLVEQRTLNPVVEGSSPS